MKPIDRLGFGPTREVIEDGEGGYIVMVTPPAILKKPTVQVNLTKDQYKRYLEWKDGAVLMQNALWDLSSAEREMLMTGLSDEDFKKATRSDEE